MMDYDHLSPTGSRSPLASSNSSNPASAGGPLLQRPPRACEYCRLHKVRCDIDHRDPSGPCGRCLKANRDCVSSSYSRKRRKTTDSRVLDLERKVERLTSRLDELEGKGGGDGEGHLQTEVRSSLPSSQTEETRPPPAVYVDPPAPDKLDAIDRQILSIELAGRIFQRYVTELAPIFPAVVFAPGTASADVRREKPVLFLSVLVAASSSFDTVLNKTLHTELLKIYADQIICRGVKSLELIQALTISVLWYHPPDTLGGNSLNLFIHLAATMATDTAINRPTAQKTPTKPDPESFPLGSAWRFMIWGSNPDSSLADCRRALVSCYFLTSCVSRLLRRPNIFPFTQYMSECLAFLTTPTNPDVYPSDTYLVHWIRLSHLAEHFSPTDAQTTLPAFLTSLAAWRVAAAPQMTPALELFSKCITKHIYDVLVHTEHISDVLRPLILETLSGRLPSTAPVHLVQACLWEVHACLDFFLSFEPQFAAVLPGLFFIEMGYSIGVLVKVFFSSCVGGAGGLGLRDVKFGEYVERLIGFLEVVSNGGRGAAARLRFIMVGVKSWVDKNRKLVAEEEVVVEDVWEGWGAGEEWGGGLGMLGEFLGLESAQGWHPPWG